MFSANTQGRRGDSPRDVVSGGIGDKATGGRLRKILHILWPAIEHIGMQALYLVTERAHASGDAIALHETRPPIGINHKVTALQQQRESGQFGSTEVQFAMNGQ